MVFRAAALAASVIWLAGCGSQGDFGRPRPSLVGDDTHAWLGQAVARQNAPPSWQHQLTDDERRLRDLAYPLIEPPYERNRWFAVLAENGFWGRSWPHPDRAGYASRLFQTAYRSQTARYSRLIDDIRNDVVRLDPFFAAARHVGELDRRRQQSLVHVSNLTREEHDNTLQRIRENSGVIRWTHASLGERVAAYQIALERLVIAAPSGMAVEAERSLLLLRQRLTAYGV